MYHKFGKAIVQVQWFLGKNPYKSESLKLNGKRSTTITSDKYEENLDMLISSLSFADYEKYEEPEYKEAVKKVSTKIYG